jgi:hypothetical protein
MDEGVVVRGRRARAERSERLSYAPVAGIPLLNKRNLKGGRGGSAQRCSLAACWRLGRCWPERLLNPEPQNWLMNHRTYDGQRFSPLDKINTSKT